MATSKIGHTRFLLGTIKERYIFLPADPTDVNAAACKGVLEARGVAQGKIAVFTLTVGTWGITVPGVVINEEIFFQGSHQWNANLGETPSQMTIMKVLCPYIIKTF